MSLHEEIAKLAYELYERNGRVDGREKEHWFEAERIIMAQNAGGNKGPAATEKKEKAKPVRKALAPKPAARKATAKTAKAKIQP